MIKNKKRGFSIAEMTMTLAIVGFISAITIPVLNWLNIIKMHLYLKKYIILRLELWMN